MENRKSICVSSLLRWQDVGPFFNQVVFQLLNFKGYLPVLDNSPLSNMSFANMFFLSVACLLILLVVSFAEVLFFFFSHSRDSLRLPLWLSGEKSA